MFRKMDETEIEINKIENMRMVHIYELTGAGFAPGKKGCTAIAVYYGDDKQINMNETDPHFTTLVNRVYSLYMSSEKKHAVMMDETTRTFLECGAKLAHEADLEKFYELEGTQDGFASYEFMLSRAFLPLAEYLLVGFYKVLEQKLFITERVNGWRGASCLSGDINGERKQFFIKISHLEQSGYSIAVSNFGENNSTLLISVKLNREYMEIYFQSEDETFNGDGRIEFEEGACKETFSIFRKGVQVYYDVVTYENTAVKERDTFDRELPAVPTDKECIRMLYRLPWGVTYLKYAKELQEGEVTATQYRTAYIMADDEYAEVRGYTLLQQKAPEITLRVDGLFVRNILLRDHRQQTYFVPVEGVSTGEYKRKLENRFFVYDAAKA